LLNSFVYIGALAAIGEGLHRQGVGRGTRMGESGEKEEEETNATGRKGRKDSAPV
jgi:hypothetical protein